LKPAKNFIDQHLGNHTFKRHISGASICVPRTLAMKIVADFVHLFSERPLRACGHLRHATWSNVDRLGTFELEKALMRISKLHEDGKLLDDDPGRQFTCVRLPRILAALNALKADAAEFPGVTVESALPADKRRKRGPRH